LNFFENSDAIFGRDDLARRFDRRSGGDSRGGARLWLLCNRRLRDADEFGRDRLWCNGGGLAVAEGFEAGNVASEFVIDGILNNINKITVILNCIKNFHQFYCVQSFNSLFLVNTRKYRFQNI
jgi:hypothetical protein